MTKKITSASLFERSQIPANSGTSIASLLALANSSTYSASKSSHKSTAKYRRCPPYTAFSSLYDAAMGEAALPAIIDAFARSRKQHRFNTDATADVGCGTGRFLKYLSRHASVLFGVDHSAAMLRRTKANTQGLDVTLLEQDLRQLELTRQVNCITCTFDTINYLRSLDELRLAFAAFAQNLMPGGVVVFDYIPAGAHSGAAGPTRQFVKWRSISSQWRIEIDPDGCGSRVTILMRRTRRDGGVDRAYEVHEQRWHQPNDVNTALRDAGFAELQSSPVEPDGTGNWLHVVAQLAPMPTN